LRAGLRPPLAPPGVRKLGLLRSPRTCAPAFSSVAALRAKGRGKRKNAMLFHGVAVVWVLTLRSVAHARAKRAHYKPRLLNFKVGKLGTTQNRRDLRLDSPGDL